MNRLAQAVCLLTVGFCTRIAFGAAEVEERSSSVRESKSAFAKGSCEFEETSGALFSLNTGFGRPRIHYAIEQLRLGIMLSDPHGSSLLAGNFEFLLQVFGGPIFEGPGSGVGGAAMIIRYNFVQPGARLVPFVQGGAGGIYSDISDTSSQELLGSNLNFNLETAIGIKYLMNRKWSVILEMDYRHVSDAGITTRNDGLDSIGGTIGLGYLF